jgi:hypothetical protein
MIAAVTVSDSSLAFAEEPGPVARIVAARNDNGAAPVAQLRFGEADALEKWNVVASASRRPWDPADALAPARFDSRAALGGETSGASLAFEWLRNLPSGNLEAAAFARSSGVDLRSNLAPFDGASYAEGFGQRDRRSRFGAAIRWRADGNLGALPSSHSIGARVRGETLDADAGIYMQSRESYDALREDRLRQSGAVLTFENEVQLAARLRAIASVRYDVYRFGVGSDLAGHSGSGGGTIASPRISLLATLDRGRELFITAGRGYRTDDPRAPGAVVDPRNGAPVGRLDPLASRAELELGVRARWRAGLQTTISTFRATSASELTLLDDTALSESTRATRRDGVQFCARYEPSAWLALDLQLTGLRARFDDGGVIPGAAQRIASAGATLRTPDGWTASLLVNSLGRRDTLAGDSAPVRSSTFVNGRLSRNLGKRSRVSLDVFNVFDQRVGPIDYFSTSRLWEQPGAGDSFLFNPAEPRGFRLKLRTTF